jgi:hypothetical protein
MPSSGQRFAPYAPGRPCAGGSLQTLDGTLLEKAHAFLINNLIFIAELNRASVFNSCRLCTKKWHFQ